MGLNFQTGFSINWVYWITSVQPDEEAFVKNMVDEQVSLANIHGQQSTVKKVSTRQEFHAALCEIKQLAENGLKPLLNFVIHGNASGGMFICGENVFVPWSVVVEELRSINVVLRNNLCVLTHTCFGFHAIKQTHIGQAAPFFILIAPEEEVSFGVVDTNVFQFYEDLWNTGDVTASFEKNLRTKMRIFYCERMLAVVLCRYIQNACRGKNAAQRRERLLTEIILDGMRPTKDNLRAVRRQLKVHVKPSQQLLDRYVATFLVGKSCPFTMDQLLMFIDKADQLASANA